MSGGNVTASGSPGGSEVFQSGQHPAGAYHADGLRKHGRKRGALNAQFKYAHQQEIPRYIQERIQDQHIQRAPGVPEGPEDPGGHVVQHHSPDTAEIDTAISQRLRKNVLRHRHHAQQPRRQDHTSYGTCQSQNQRHGVGGTDAAPQPLMVPCPIIARDQDRGAGGQTVHEVDWKFEQRVYRVDGC